MNKRQRIEQAIALQESLRGTVEDALIDLTIAALRKQLDQLQPAPEQQRKLVTILFADIVGSTSVIRDLDPEENLEIMDRGLKRMSVPVSEHGGHVTRFTGDGFKAVFGAPLARENDPEMAIRAGLGILEVVRNYANELQEQWGISDFEVRVGINTGLAALGGLTEAEDTVMGSTVNLAKRIESAAPPGSVLISHNTYRHVRGIFDVEPLKPISVKGFEEPVQVYLVERARPRAFWTRTLEVEGIETRMVGRDREFQQLKAALRNLLDQGQGGLITISGEAGVGKSRLLYEFENWFELLPEYVRFFQGRGRRETQHQPYTLLRDLFTFRFQIQEHDSLEQVHQKLEEGFGEIFGMDEGGQMRAHIIGQLLGFDFQSSPYLQGISEDPQQLFERGLVYLQEFFTTISAHQPTVIFLEDIHWADDSSLNALDQLGRQLSTESVMIVCVARTRLFERLPDWGSQHPAHTHLELVPLSEQDSYLLVEEILKQVNQIPESFPDLVVRAAEGNPFYIEEMIKMLIDDGVIIVGYPHWQIVTDRLAEIHVPPTLTSLLQARLDSLPHAERIVLQQAAVVGRTFWDALIVHINTSQEHGIAISELSAALSSLSKKEILYRQTTSAFRAVQEFNFKQVMLRDVAYESVLKRERKVYHAAVAEWLIERSADRRAEYTGQIADHLELAGEYHQAAAYLVKAGDQARMVYALSEAERYYRRAVEIQRQQGEDEQAGRTLMKLGLVYTATFEADKARQAYADAFVLWKPQADSEQLANLGAPTQVLRIATDEPKTLDPGLVSDDFSVFLVAQLFDGLVRIGQDYNVLPEAATHWEILDDGKRYIFHLREGLLWSDGSALTASDFEYAWKRNLDPRLDSPSAKELYVLHNGRAFGEGQIDKPEEVGVTALDESTLDVRLEAPTAYLPYLLSQPVAYPLPRWAVESHATDWMHPGKLVSNGAYVLERWEPGERFVLTKNPNYKNTFHGNAEQIEGVVIAEFESALQYYSENAIDAVTLFNANPSTIERAHAEYSDELVSIPYPTVLYLAFRSDIPPFNDVKVRKAFIHAINRVELAEHAFHGLRKPALGGFIPPGLPGHSPTIGLPYNPDLSGRLLAQAGYSNGGDFPSVSWMHGRSSSGERVVTYLRTTWQQTLGLDLKPESMGEWSKFLDRTINDPAQLTLIGWGADFPDPDMMLRTTFHSIEGRNIPRWHNRSYDSLVDEAGRVSDQKKRVSLYQEADRILVAEQAVVMPISYGEGRMLVKPWVHLPPTLSIQLPLKDIVVKGGGN